jgi:hypothetical protein
MPDKAVIESYAVTAMGQGEQPTRLRVWQGVSPCTVNYLVRTVSISGACGGNKAR